MKTALRNWIRSDWSAAFLLLAIFLGIKGYKFGWDDQHLEIPLLKGLIDKTLYVGDYYVESLKVNFVSYFYPLLARIITVSQIPAAYFTLYLISKYFLFFWVYKLWRHISQEKSIALMCTIIFMTFGRTPELLYRTFSHQEFSLAFIFAGIYFFFKERFILAAAILGIASNFHFLYSLFPMIYLGVYLVWQHRRHGWDAVLKSSAAFAIAALPIVIWIVRKNFLIYLNNPTIDESPIPWQTIYKLACPQNFIFFGITPEYMLTYFQTWLGVMISYFLLVALYLFNICFNGAFRANRKISSMVMTILTFLMTTYYFSYIHPSRFVLDLNLVRNTQFLYFFLMGYTTIFAIKSIDQGKIPTMLVTAFFFGLMVLNDHFAIVSLLAWALSLLLIHNLTKPNQTHKILIRAVTVLGLAVCGIAFFQLLRRPEPLIRLAPTILFGLLFIAFVIYRIPKWDSHKSFIRRLFVMLPLIAVGVYLVNYHYRFALQETKGSGFWKLQREWEDMQRFVQANTPKDAMLLVPNDMEMGGFRILSERKIVCCYRDCGIVGFDYSAAIEWIKRLGEIKSFKVILEENGDFKQALFNAIVNYKTDYIVFMRYYAPKDGAIGFLRKIYENDSFALFQVLPHPALHFSKP